VPQGEAEPLFSVREIVAMGRYPRLGPWRREQTEDVAAINAAMERCDVANLAHRWLSTLSGGERQRVRLARALAQQPSVLALDEPTTFLDIRHEMTTFELLRRLRDEGVGVVLVTHNLNLAARYADELILLNRGRLVAHGSPSEVLTKERVDAVYEWPVSIVRDSSGAPQVMPLSESAR
jgi:iron complex transport system ATP-binding protein